MAFILSHWVFTIYYFFRLPITSTCEHSYTFSLICTLNINCVQIRILYVHRSLFKMLCTMLDVPQHGWINQSLLKSSCFLVSSFYYDAFKTLKEKNASLNTRVHKINKHFKYSFPVPWLYFKYSLKMCKAIKGPHLNYIRFKWILEGCFTFRSRGHF